MLKHIANAMCRFSMKILIIGAIQLTGCVYNDELSPALSAQGSHTVSGKVHGKGIDLSGVVVSDGVHNAITDSTGYYSIDGVNDGTYSIVPTKDGLAFSPLQKIVTIPGTDLNEVDFTATALPIVDMVVILSSTFQMGSNNGNPDERPVHNVTLGKYRIGKYEITQYEWMAVMGNNPSNYHGGNNPVERVTWYDAISFCNALSIREGLSLAYTINGQNVSCDFHANGYRLPTEAEWEYACRAGTTTDRYTGNVSSTNKTGYFDEKNLDTIAWYSWNSDSTTHPVGQLKPNRFGIYDMQGNVTEWCWDYWGAYPSSALSDPLGPLFGTSRVLRGGSWFDKPWEVRSAFHRTYVPNTAYSGVGFRICQTSL